MSTYEVNDTLDDYYVRLQKLAGTKIAEDVMKINGICYCGQCKVKLNKLLVDLAARLEI